MLALVLHHHTGKPLGTFIFCIDGTIIFLGAAVFGVNKALYSILAVFFISQAVNETMKHFDEITAKILSLTFRQHPQQQSFIVNDK